MKNSRVSFISSASAARRAAFILLLAATVQTISAQSLKDVTEETCVRGDCNNDRGTLELKTPFGAGKYVGNFKEGEFHGHGRLEVPISFTEKSIYVGNWDRGIRSGRGKYWNGKGKLYIGQWRDDERNGHGSYFFNLPRWNENEHSEFWLSENTENYTGNFIDDKYQGQGTYRWPAGQKYIGGFFANSKHGPGIYYYETGVERRQVWEYGDFVK